ncbi:MAG: PASTA domain-containing protein [Pyrinomonadaceae bacterium MAG19_C2-C3]|nr:PASTA domain-containing protein [Pyrinomonadaceae bacterium MAG19_C2-C3]
MASFTQGIMRALGRLGVIALGAMLFVAGVAGAVYYSLRSPEVNVPKVVGNDRFSAEDALEQAGLNMRVRASRYSPNAKADTVLDQNPRAGETVKAGQTIAVVVSRTQAREGEEAIAQAELEAAELEAEVAEEANSAVNSNRQNSNDNRAVSVLARTNANNRARNTNANKRNSNNANNANNSNNGNTTNDNRNANNGNATNNAANTNAANNANRANANTNNANRSNANNANRNTTSNANNRNANNRNSNNRNTNTRNPNNRTTASPANRNTRP